MKTLVVGASTNPARYSNKAIELLVKKGYEVAAFGMKAGEVCGVKIKQDWSFTQIGTITLYVSAKNQPLFYQQILDLKPRRVIFNPGTENAEFYQILKDDGIEVEEACTLVLLSIGQF